MNYRDGDGALDFDDNCVLSPNSDQSDIDADGLGSKLYAPSKVDLEK